MLSWLWEILQCVFPPLPSGPPLSALRLPSIIRPTVSPPKCLMAWHSAWGQNHPCDPVAAGPLLRHPLHPLTPDLLTHCPTLPLASLPRQPAPLPTLAISSWNVRKNPTKVYLEHGLRFCLCVVNMCVLFWACNEARPLPLQLLLSILFWTLLPYFLISVSLLHLSVRSFYCMFICDVCTRSVSQSPSRVLMCLFLSYSLVFFFVCLPNLPSEKLLRVFVASLSHFHGDWSWLTTRKEGLFMAAAGENVRDNICAYAKERALMCLGTVFLFSFLHPSMFVCMCKQFLLRLWVNFSSSKDYCDVYLGDTDK